MFNLQVFYIVLVVMVYINVLYVSYIPNHDIVLLSWMSDLCTTIKQYPAPEFVVARKYSTNSVTSSYKDYDMHTCHNVHPAGKWHILERPIWGNHIHIGYTLHIGGKDIVLRDHNMTHNVPYEHFPATCANPPPYAYVKKWYHTGVHTHCDGIIHIHPFSAPRELRVEGRNVNLGIFFENEGIFMHPNGLFEIPGISKRVKLHMEYYVNVQHKNPILKTSDPIEIINTWLVDHHGYVLLWDKKKPKKNFKVLDYEKHPSDYPQRTYAK